jgi:hypothetical protein
MTVAIYCREGHYVGYIAESVRALSWHQVQELALQAMEDEENPDSRNFCRKCGASTIRSCQHCQAPLESKLLMLDRPAYCGTCGKPFPWTETALTAATEFTDELQELSVHDRTALKATFVDLTSDTPKTELAAHRFKSFFSKIAPAAGEGLKSIIVNVVTEAAKKKMGF